MGVERGAFWRKLRAAAWLGWQVESNWTDPFLFFIYALAKPLATGLILLAMYFVVMGGATDDPRLAWMYVGNAFFTFVPLVLVGVGWAVVEDREMYQMLKYVYVSPIGLFTFLAGRSVTKLGISIIACVLLLVIGVVILGIRLTVTGESLLLGLVAFPLGVIGIFALGLILGGLGLVFARHSVNLNEGAAAVLYLFCGAIFPVDLLPAILRWISLGLPITWWLESMRRAFGIPSTAGVLAGFSDVGILGVLAASTIFWYVVGAASYRLLEHRAKQLGLLDQTTNF